MNPRFFRLILALVSGAFVASEARAKGLHREMTAVYSVTQPGYERERMNSGQFVQETYVFGEGDFDGAAGADPSFGRLTFMDIARMLREPLADQNYVNSLDPEATDILIMVHWGSTRVDTNLAFGGAAGYRETNYTSDDGPGSSTSGSAAGSGSNGRSAPGNIETYLAMAKIHDEQRTQSIRLNAKKLGFYEEILETAHYPDWHSMYEQRRELLDEIEDPRYFVVLLAYDFQELYKNKEKKLLWETRFSLRSRGQWFDVALPSMAKYASQYFGQTTKGLNRARIPIGEVEIGEATVVEGDLE